MRTFFIIAGAGALLLAIAGGIYGIVWFFWGNIGDHNGRCGGGAPRRRPQSPRFRW